jgi:hypothetical protein
MLMIEEGFASRYLHEPLSFNEKQANDVDAT